MVSERYMEREFFGDLLSKKVPSEALPYCVELFEAHPFRFKLSKSRSSKLGDYRYHPKTRSHTVTVNSDLNPYQFLITYVHEVAHRVAHQPMKGLKPHGVHWKNTFRQLMLPLLNDKVFPDDILRVLARHMKNPKASTSGDPLLFATLSRYDAKPSGPVLKELPVGQEFVFRQRSFKKLEEKRTRALCLDLENNRRYLIPMLATIESLE